MQGAWKTVEGSMLCGAASCQSAWKFSQENPLLFGITRHQPVFGGTTEVGNLRDSSDSEEGARDGQCVWCAQALRQSLPQTGNLPLSVQQEYDNNTRTMSYKYRLKRRGIDTVIEELKQRLKSTASKIKRYSHRVNQFHENHMFETDQMRFYQKLKGLDQSEVPPIEPQSTLEF